MDRARERRRQTYRQGSLGSLQWTTVRRWRDGSIPVTRTGNRFMSACRSAWLCLSARCPLRCSLSNNLFCPHYPLCLWLCYYHGVHSSMIPCVFSLFISLPFHPSVLYVRAFVHTCSHPSIYPTIHTHTHTHTQTNTHTHINTHTHWRTHLSIHPSH